MTLASRRMALATVSISTDTGRTVSEGVAIIQGRDGPGQGQPDDSGGGEELGRMDIFGEYSQQDWM